MSLKEKPTANKKGTPFVYYKKIQERGISPDLDHGSHSGNAGLET
jgi:hypothetical protein